MLPNEKTITLKVKTLRSGQPKPYAASIYEYEIEVDGMQEFEVKQYCTKVLQQCNQPYEKWDSNNAESYFAGYYKFNKIDSNKYHYIVKIPFCD